MATATLAGCRSCSLASWVLAVDVRRGLGVVRLARARADRRAGRLHLRGRPGRHAPRRPCRSRSSTHGSSPASRSDSWPAASPGRCSSPSLGTTESVLARRGRRRRLVSGLVEVTRRRYPAQLPWSSTRRGRGRAPDAARPGAQPLRDAHRRVPDALGGGEPVARLPRARQRGAALRQQRRTGAIHQPVLGHRLRNRHPVPPRSCRLAAPPLRPALRIDRERDRGAAVVVAIIVATSLVGSAATIVFVLIVAARVTDLTFSDGTSRTSLSAAYQAVPTGTRSVAQATVEGLAVPVGHRRERRGAARRPVDRRHRRPLAAGAHDASS